MVADRHRKTADHPHPPAIRDDETPGQGGQSLRESAPHRYKLILNTNPRDITELYDLKEDPKEMKNLASDAAHRDLLQDLTRQLLEEMRLTADPALKFVEAQL